MGVVLKTRPSDARRRAAFCGANCGYSHSFDFCDEVDDLGAHRDAVAGDENQGFALGETVDRVGLAVLLVDLGLLKTEHTPFAVQAWFQSESSWLGWLDRADQDFCSGQSGSLNQPRHLCLQPGGRGPEACRDEAQDLQAVGFGPR